MGLHRIIVIGFSVVVLGTTFAHAKVRKKVEPQTIAPANPLSLLNYQFSLGNSYDAYNSSAVSMAQYSIVMKAGFQFLFDQESPWSVQLNSFFTALPLHSSSVLVNGSLNSVTIRTLGINARMGYRTPWLQDPWQWGLNVGWYFNTTFVTDSLFGYSGATGPQFYPTLTYRLAEHTTLSTYFKFSPMLESDGVMKPAENHEIAAGLIAHLPWSVWGSDQVLMQADFAHLSLKPGSVRIFSNSSSLSFGILFH